MKNQENINFYGLRDKILNQDEIIGVIGCGYIGLELIKNFSGKCSNIYGFDINHGKIEELKRTGFINVHFTTEFALLAECDVIVIAVPTPLKDYKPELLFVDEAINQIKKYLSIPTLIIIESSVSIGYTREAVLNIQNIFRISECEKDFFMGASPERIMPGDTKHTMGNTPKLIAGFGTHSLELMDHFYSKVVKKTVPSLFLEEVEAAKLIENTQRNVNIAFMNECAIKLKEKEVDSREVFKLCKSHWNWVDIQPGLVGGSCIPVSPYYLWEHDNNSIISGALVTNVNLVSEITKVIYNLAEGNLENKKVLILGATYKDNVDSVKGSRIFELERQLQNRKAIVNIYEPVIDEIAINPEGYDIVIIGTASKWITEIINRRGTENFYSREVLFKDRILIDIPGILKEPAHYKYWRLR